MHDILPACCGTCAQVTNRVWQTVSTLPVGHTRAAWKVTSPPFQAAFIFLDCSPLQNSSNPLHSTSHHRPSARAVSRLQKKCSVFSGDPYQHSAMMPSAPAGLVHEDMLRPFAFLHLPVSRSHQSVQLVEVSTELQSAFSSLERVGFRSITAIARSARWR